MPGYLLEILIAGFFGLATISPAVAQGATGPGAQSAGLYAAGLAASCASCHGTGGRAVVGSAVGPLAGLDAAYFIEQMRAFKTGARPATVMHQISKGFSDAQIESMATYFAVQGK